MYTKNLKVIHLCLIVITLYFGIKLFDEMLFIIKYIFKLLFPILLGFTIAFVLYPFKRRLIKRKLSNGLSTIISMLIFIAIFIVVFILVIPNLVTELTKFIENIPNYLLFVEQLYAKISTNLFKNINITQYIKPMLFDAIGNLSVKTFNVFQTIISYSVSFFISLFISIYFLYDFEKIIDWIKKTTINYKDYRLYVFLEEVKNLMYAFFKGMLQLSLILFILAALSFWLIGLDYFIVVSLILSITNIIPYLGPYIGGSFAVLIGLNHSTEQAIFAFLIVIILQFLDNYIISPKIQGSSIQIKPVIIIISIFIMGSLFGIFGMILAVPTVSIVNSFYQNFVLNKEQS